MAYLFFETTICEYPNPNISDKVFREKLFSCFLAWVNDNTKHLMQNIGYPKMFTQDIIQFSFASLKLVEMKLS